MSNIRLGQHRADTLKPRKKPYDIRDGELKGFGLRVLPSGKKRYFVHSQHRGQRIWKNIGDGGVMSEPEARAGRIGAGLHQERRTRRWRPAGTDRFRGGGRRSIPALPTQLETGHV